VQARAVHTVAAVRAILTSMTFVLCGLDIFVYSVLLFQLLIYHKTKLCHDSLFSS